MASKPFPIPSIFLADLDEPKIAPKTIPNPKPKSNKTFAQALQNVCDIPHCQLPKLGVKGEVFSIAIPEEEY